MVIGAPLTIGADAFKTASGDLESKLRLICEPDSCLSGQPPSLTAYAPGRESLSIAFIAKGQCGFPKFRAGTQAIAKFGRISKENGPELRVPLGAFRCNYPLVLTSERSPIGTLATGLSAAGSCRSVQSSRRIAVPMSWIILQPIRTPG